jgi:hypothetical protein
MAIGHLQKLLKEEAMTQVPKIGDAVRATMDGKKWFSGILCGEIDFFVPYGVRIDENGELRYFAHIEPLDLKP